MDWVRIESASTPSGIELGTTTTTAHSESDAVAFDLDKSSLRHVPCKLQRHAAIRIGVRFAPILSAASTTATTGGGLVHHRAVLCVAVGVPLAAKRRRRVLRIHLVATALLPTLTAPLVPVAAVTTTAAPAPIKRLFATSGGDHIGFCHSFALMSLRFLFLS